MLALLMFVVLLLLTLLLPPLLLLLLQLLLVVLVMVVVLVLQQPLLMLILMLMRMRMRRLRPGAHQASSARPPQPAGWRRLYHQHRQRVACTAPAARCPPPQRHSRRDRAAPPSAP